MYPFPELKTIPFVAFSEIVQTIGFPNKQVVFYHTADEIVAWVHVSAE